MVTLSDRRKLIEEKQEEFYFPQIKKFIEDNGSMSWDEIKDTLTKRDIPEDVLDKFNATDDESYEDESIGEDSSGKKKRWGLF